MVWNYNWKSRDGGGADTWRVFYTLTLTTSNSQAEGIRVKISLSNNRSDVVAEAFSTKSILIAKPKKSRICPTVSSDFN